MTETQLVIGEQAAAARVVVAAMEPLRTQLKALSDAAQSASSGYVGGSANACAQALGAWFEAAGNLLPVMEQYAADLAQVDQTELRTEERQQASFARLAARLGQVGPVSGGRSLVVQQGALSDLEAALTKASEEIRRHVTTTLDQVDAATFSWNRATASRTAEQQHQQRLRDGVETLFDKLDALKVAIADARELARDKEVDNVALCE